MQEIWNIKRVLNWTLDYFEKNQVPEARLSSELLLSHVFKCKRLDLYLQFERILTPAELKEYRGYIKRRIKYEPVAYILGEQEFLGLKFKVNPNVLIPRPETEILVEEVLGELKKTSTKPVEVLDVGTGSGAIAISIGHHCQSCNVTAIDSSETAIMLAKENAKSLSVENIHFAVIDALQLPADMNNKFDFILINPPYVAEKQREQLHPQVKDFEPEAALFAGKEGMEFISAFIPKVSFLLKTGGLLFMEIGYNQKESILKLLQQNNFINIQFIQDYQKIDRIVKAKYE